MPLVAVAALCLMVGATEEVRPRVLEADKPSTSQPTLQAFDPMPRWSLDAAVVTTTQRSSSGVGTDLVPEVALRVGAAWPLWRLGPGQVELGALGAVGLGQDTSGTRSVRVARTYLQFVGRGQAGFVLGSDRLALVPFGFVEAGIGPGVSAAKVQAQVRLAPTLMHSLRAGAGLALRLWGLSIALDLGGGQVTLKPAVTTWASVGWRF